MDIFRVLIYERSLEHCLIDQNSEEVLRKKSISATIRIGREIWCLTYAEKKRVIHMFRVQMGFSIV